MGFVLELVFELCWGSIGVRLRFVWISFKVVVIKFAVVCLEFVWSSFGVRLELF